MDSTTHIGISLPRIEGSDKVSGKAVYCADISRNNMLYIAPVFSCHPRAVIKNVNLEEALALPGVIGVFSTDDIPGEKCHGILCPDQQVFAGHEVFNASDIIAVVAAETQSLADKAAKLIQVDYEPLDRIITTGEALSSPPINPDYYPSNCFSEYHALWGDSSESVDDVITIENTFSTQYIEHAYIEPEAVVTELDPDGRLVVHGSIQTPFYLKDAVCACLALPMNRVSIRRSVVGGSFGGKVELVHTMAIQAGLVTLRTRRPVKYVLTREQSFRLSHKRHPSEIALKLSAHPDGQIISVDGTAYLKSGPYMMMSPCVSWKCNVTGFGCYRLESGRYTTSSIQTNGPGTSSMRGFGTPQALFALESSVNELAFRLGMSPYSIRKMNALRQGDTTSHGHVLDGHNVSLTEALDNVEKALDFENKFKKYSKENASSGRFRRGVGIALSMRGTSSGAEANDISRARVEIEKDGSVRVFIGLAEIGQGLRTVMTQIAAEALSLPPESIYLNLPDTDLEMDTGACVGSRGTMLGGHAIINAVNDLKAVFADAWNFETGADLRAEEIRFSQGNVLFGDTSLSMKAAAAMCYRDAFTLSATGTFRMPNPQWNPDTQQGIPFASYTYNAQAAEVEVDTYTGRVKVIKMCACHDVGQCINPDMTEGQIQGGMVMSLGYALTEDFKVENGIPVTRDFTTYLIPGITDVPEMEVTILQHSDDAGPFGAKGIAEAALELGISSISAAVNHALGMKSPIRSTPVTPEKVLNSLNTIN